MLFRNRTLAVPVIAEHATALFGLNDFATTCTFVECLAAYARDLDGLLVATFRAGDVSDDFFVFHIHDLLKIRMSTTPIRIPAIVSTAPMRERLRYTANAATMTVTAYVSTFFFKLSIPYTSNVANAP